MSVIFISMQCISQVIFPRRVTRKLSNSDISQMDFWNFPMGNSTLKIFQVKIVKVMVYSVELWNFVYWFALILEHTQNCFLRKIFMLSTVISDLLSAEVGQCQLNTKSKLGTLVFIRGHSLMSLYSVDF